MLKEEYESEGGNRTAARLRAILNPRARWEKMHREGRDLGDMLSSWEKDVAKYRMAAGATLQQIIQVATVLENAPAAHRDLLKMVPLANRESLGGTRLRTRQHRWTLDT